MKVILYMAVSADGYIADSNDNTSWVCPADWKEFERIGKEVGVILYGRNTFETSKDDIPFHGVTNIVLSRDTSLKHTSEKIIFTNKTPKEVVKMVEEMGFKELLVVGGGIINGAFLREGLFDEIILSVHPYIFGSGKKLFRGVDVKEKLKLTQVKKLAEDLVQTKYEVKRKK